MKITREIEIEIGDGDLIDELAKRSAYEFGRFLGSFLYARKRRFNKKHVPLNPEEVINGIHSNIMYQEVIDLIEKLRLEERRHQQPINE